MAVTFAQTSLPLQVWTLGRDIIPVIIPPATGIGQITYDWARQPDGRPFGLPVGVDFNPDTRVVYGVPREIIADGQFVVTAVDDDDAANTFTLQFQVVSGLAPLRVAPPPVIPLYLTQQVGDLALGRGIRLPTPTGGSGDYSSQITLPDVGERQANPDLVFLPDGVEYDPDRRLLYGVVRNTDPNRGGDTGVVFSATLNNAGWVTASNRLFTGLRGGATLSSATGVVDGTSFTMDTIFTFSGRGDQATRERTGGLRVGMTPDIEDLPQRWGNNVQLRIDEIPSRGADPVRVDAGFYFVGYANEIAEGRAINLNWTRQPEFVFTFRRGSTYYISWIATQSPVYEWRVRDRATGEEVRHPLRFQLITPAGLGYNRHSRLAIPANVPTPALRRVDNTARTVTAELQAPPLGVVGARAAVVPAGRVPPVAAEYAPQPFTAGQPVQVVAGDLASNSEYDLYVQYQNAAGDDSAPLVVYTGTEPDRDASRAPRAVLGLRGTGYDGRAVMSWDSPTGWQEIRRYEYQLDGGPARPMHASDATTEQYTIPGLVNERIYTIGVRAVNTAGAGPWEHIAVDISGTPYPFPESRMHLQVLIDPTGDGDPWMGISTRLVAARISYGRQPGAPDFTYGYAELEFYVPDAFFAATDGIYTADELRNRLVFVNEVYELESGNVARITAFSGRVETIEFRSRRGLGFAVMRVTDIFTQLQRVPLVFTEPLPEETVRQRMVRLIEAARAGTGLPLTEFDLDDPPIRCAPIAASEDAPYEVSLLPGLRQVANSAGGRLYVGQGRRFGFGQLRFEARGPLSGIVGTLTDDPEGDANRHPEWDDPSRPLVAVNTTPVVEEDPSNIYNVARLRWPGPDSDVEYVVEDRDDRSIDRWGERLWRGNVVDVVTDLEGTRSLAAHIVRVYSQPRNWAQQVLVQPWTLSPSQAYLVGQASLEDAFRVSFIRPGAKNRTEHVQRVDSVERNYRPGGADSPYCFVDITLGLLVPEASNYWVASREDANELSISTFVGPPVVGDDSLSGAFPWAYTEGDPFDALVSSPRYRRFYSGPMWAVYLSEQERDLEEAEAVDGTPTLIYATEPDADGNPVDRVELQVYSEADNQWLVRGRLSSADANPTPTVLQYDTDKWDNAHIYGA